jgi:hypothetical protein
MSLFSDAQDTVLGGLREVGKSAIDAAKDIAKTNIENVKKNATVKSSDPAAYAPVKTGTSPTGKEVIPGVTDSAANAAAGVPTWAWWLGGISFAVGVVGVVVMVRG